MVKAACNSRAIRLVEQVLDRSGALLGQKRLAGGDVFVGIGLATGPDRGAAAAANALEGLAALSVAPAGADGLLADIMGSTNMSMEDFDNGSRVLRSAVPEDANVICGCSMDDALGDNIRVTAFASIMWRWI